MQYWKLVRDRAIPQTVPGAIQAPVTGSDQWGHMIADEGFASNEHPKLAFNFTMEIMFGSDVKRNIIRGDHLPAAIMIPLKTATRPQPTVNYQDVNFYNMRSKVATSIDWGTVSLTFYDDATSRAHSLLTDYLRAVSPASRISLIDQVAAFGQTSSLGPIGREMGIIKTLKVYHYYRNRGQDYRNVYVYMNPKVVNFTLDDLDMSGSEANTVALTFNFDAVHSYVENLVEGVDLSDALEALRPDV